MAKSKLVWRYLNFDLSVEPSRDGGFQARAWIRGEAVGRTIFHFSLQADRANLAVSTDRSSRDLQQKTGAKSLDGKLGQRLYEQAFSGEVGSLFVKTRARLGLGQGLRLRLRLCEEVSDWPWELLHDGSDFLADAAELSIVRFLELPKRVRPLRMSHPLRVLVIPSRPRGQHALDLESEWKQIQSALKPLVRKKQVRVERLIPPTLPALLRCVTDSEYHVLHFMGHGTFDHASQTGLLYFEDESGCSVPITGEELARLLGKSIRLVVLNACEGAKGISQDRFSGVAQSLVRKGIPAVIAMRWAIDDSTAIAAAQSFYAALVKGKILDRAMSAMRKRLIAERAGTYEWANPILFLRARNGRIFKWGPHPLKLLGAALIGALIIVAGYRVYHLLTLPPVPPSRPTMPVDPDCPSPKGVDMEFVKIPEGRFEMGSIGEEDNESPPHPVTITRPFCLGVHEVSQEQWKKVMGQVNDQTQPRDDLPMASVSWYQAQEFVDRLNILEGRQAFRLPREAEWEYAARGPKGSSSERGNCLHDDHYERLAPVGSYKTNEWNLYDMNGNVWEWVQDWSGFYDSGVFTDPTGPPAGQERVKRGGSFHSANKNCRPSYRNSQPPDRRSNDVGFRLVREIEKPN